MNSRVLSLFVLLSVCVYLAHCKSLLPDAEDSIDNDITQSDEVVKFQGWFQGEVREFATELAQEIWKKFKVAEERQMETSKRGGNTAGCSKWSGWKFMGGCK